MARRLEKGAVLLEIEKRGKMLRQAPRICAEPAGKVRYRERRRQRASEETGLEIGRERRRALLDGKEVRKLNARNFRPRRELRGYLLDLPLVLLFEDLGEGRLLTHLSEF